MSASITAPLLAEDARAALWRSLGATEEETRELLEYARSEFDLSRAPASFPLPDEPFVAAWTGYVEEAERVGVWACLRDRLVQLRFPIEPGISESPAYLAATRRGVWPAPESRGLELARPEELRLFLAETPVGRVPVILATTREDFVALVRALGHRNEPWPISDAVGASIIGGFNNWDPRRVAAAGLGGQPFAGRLIPGVGGSMARDRPRARALSGPLHRARLRALQRRGRRGTSASTRPSGRGAPSPSGWSTNAHTTSPAGVLGSMRNRLADELIADYMGIVAATGSFRADWLVRFLGLERHPVYRSGGRLEAYRGDLAQGGGSFRVLCAAARCCARKPRSDRPAAAALDPVAGLGRR